MAVSLIAKLLNLMNSPVKHIVEMPHFTNFSTCPIGVIYFYNLGNVLITFAVSQYAIRGRTRLGKENMFGYSFLRSRGYESSCKACPVVEQVLCHLLHHCCISRPIILFPNICKQGKLFTVCCSCLLCSMISS